MTPLRQVALGVAVVAIAVVLANRSASSSDVPNDPNIGAGLLFTVGIVLVIAGAVRWWPTRRRSRP